MKGDAHSCFVIHFQWGPYEEISMKPAYVFIMET